MDAAADLRLSDPVSEPPGQKRRYARALPVYDGQNGQIQDNQQGGDDIVPGEEKPPGQRQ